MDAFFDRAIVLEKRKVGDDTIEALFLSETRGKFWGKAPAVARSRKRFPAGIEHFALFETELAQTSRQKKPGWGAIKMARPLMRYSLTRDLAHYSAAARITELVNRLLPLSESGDNPTLSTEYRGFFNLLISSYATLEAAPPETTDIVLVWFEWRILVLLGYALDPFRCPGCEAKFNEETPAFWCPGQQGLVCSACFGEGARECRKLSSPALLLAQKCAHTPVPGGFGQKVSLPTTTAAAIEEIKGLLDNQIRPLLTRPLKTDAFNPEG